MKKIMAVGRWALSTLRANRRRLTEAAPDLVAVYAAEKRPFVINTLHLVKRMESSGVATKQAEAIALAMAEVVADGLETAAKSFARIGDLQKDKRISALQVELEKASRALDQKISDLKVEVEEKTSALKVEMKELKGNIETNQSIFKEHVIQSKHDVLKYGVATIAVACSAVFIALRLLK